MANEKNGQNLKTVDLFSELLKIFKSFDENGDGKVSKHELVRASKKMGVNKTLKDIEKVLRTINTDSKIKTMTLF